MKKNIFSAFEEVAKKRGTNTAVIYLGTRYSYRRLKNMAEGFAAALIDMGLKAGQKVIIYTPNSIQWVVAWLGILRMGGVCVPITPIYTPHDLSYIANDSGAEAIVCADTNFGYVKRVLPDTGIKKVVVTKMAELLPCWKRFFGYLFDVIPRGKTAFDKNTYSLRKLLSRQVDKARELPAITGYSKDTAEILYTGGTTKFSKGVPITHELFLVSAGEQIRVSEPLFPVEENIILGNAPLFHILGQTCSLSAILVGGTLMLQPKVNLDATFDSIRRFRAKTMIGVPALYRMI
ncbi:MAG: acyl--CoA ligase, partial [Deltaproteobacteria bacterium]|nr:acyl--CoA ligase [Deltaproteobacteria bacterium]